MRILLTGAGGFIGRHLAAQIPSAVPVRHEALATIALEDVDLVIHAGRAAAIGTERWRLDQDLEHGLLTRLARQRARYVMLSTRAVYGRQAGLLPLRESDPTLPVTAYGRNKLRLEQAATTLLGQERLCILRLSNVFGFEWPGRTTFFGTMLERLRAEGLIRFAMAGSTRRDFVPVRLAAAMIARLALGKLTGVIHVGAGRSLPCAALAEAVIAGYGSGRLVIDKAAVSDEFAFDTGIASTACGIEVSEAAILAAATEAGRLLAKAP